MNLNHEIGQNVAFISSSAGQWSFTNFMVGLVKALKTRQMYMDGKKYVL